LTPLGGKRVHDRRGIVSFDDELANHRHGDETEAERHELVVRGVIFLDVFHRKGRTFL
jgi:hypothetical protein